MLVKLCLIVGFRLKITNYIYVDSLWGYCYWLSVFINNVCL